MNRRQLLQKALLGGTALLSMKTLAQAAGSASGTGASNLSLQVTISRNHGHDLTIVNTDEFVMLLRRIENEGSSSLSIQGRSRHPHMIEIDAQSAMDILLGKEVKFTSTRDAGHIHDVTLKLG